MSGNDDPSLIPWKENVTPAGHSINTKNTVPCCAPTTEPTIPSHHASEEDRIRRLLLEEAGYDCAKTLKRTTYLSWDDYFMAAAFLSAQRSKDPLSPQGACLVDHHQRVIGIGYNGFPRHCSDDLLPWTASSTTGDQCWLHSPHPYVCHAEVNAILNKCSDTVEGARLYVANFPCNECAKVIVQSGIREVVYLYDWDHDKDPYRASRILLTLGGVTTRQYVPQAKHVLLHLVPEDETLASTDQHDCNSQPQQTLNDADARALVWKEARWNGPCTKRRSYLSWDDYFMAMAFLTAKRSKDPNTQVGACIVSPNKKILALGYNGFPRKCSDDHLPWARTGESKLHTKYPYVCHAEVNAILNKCSSNVEGGTLYVALFPCNECAKLIIQAGISEVVYLLDIYHDDDSCRASRILLTMAGVKLRHYVPTVKQILLELNTTDKEEKRSSDLN